MRLSPIISTFLFLTISIVSSAKDTVTWETLGNKLNADEKPFYTSRFTITADAPFEGLAFCQFKRPMVAVNPEDTLIEILPGYFMISSPRFNNISAGEPIVVDINVSGVLKNDSFTPDGFHLVRDGKPIEAINIKKSAIAFPEQWINPLNGSDGMIYGDEAFIINDSLKSYYRAEPFKQIPTPKKISLGDKKIKVSELTAKGITIEPIIDSRFDYWTATIGSEGIRLKTNSSHPDVIAKGLLRRIEESEDSNGYVPIADIEDWSDYDYRGFMFDTSRNFLPKEAVEKVIDLMSRYGLNVLHFHLGDDEGWRLEIPSLPELTEVGARRGFTLTDDVDFLKGIYAGNGDPNAATTANGYYSVEEFIEILKYADEAGIAVIPEFDTPGHSRAAIRAMEWRYKNTDDKSLRLIEENDTSHYTTAQAFHDNIMNPALDGPYKFWSIVFDDIRDIYNRANVPLRAINIGGDEVPLYAWDGSDEVKKLFGKEKLESLSPKERNRLIHGYFVEKVAELAKEKDIKIAGWQEIALNHPDDYDQKVVPVVEAVNSWTNASNQGLEMAKKGYPIIMSNVDYLYVDQTSTTHPEEPGMVWGGLVTEFSPLHATADILVPGDSTVQSNVKGISAHLFAETVRDLPMVERYMLPRLLGLAERGHNAKPTLSDEEYFGLLTSEMEKWANEGTNFYVRQPGIKVVDGKVIMNEPYGMGEIRYTTDNNEPTSDSQVYTGPFESKDAEVIRAKLFIGPAKSSTSILYLNKQGEMSLNNSTITD